MKQTRKTLRRSFSVLLVSSLLLTSAQLPVVNGTNDNSSPYIGAVDNDDLYDFETREPFYGYLPYDYEGLEEEGASSTDAKFDPRYTAADPVTNSLVLTPVKDQSATSNCWNFSTAAVLETFTRKFYNHIIDVSENHVQYALAIPAVGEAYGYNKTLGSGSLVQRMAPYYFRPYLGGPVLESVDGPLSLVDDEKTTSSRTAASIQEKTRHGRVTGLQLIPTPKKGTVISPGQDAKFKQQIKDAVFQYGAAAVSIQATTTSANGTAGYQDHIKDGYSKTFFTTLDDTDHAVTIVGWDDSVPASYFKNVIDPATPATNNTNLVPESASPPGNGGWIVKNSYGPTSSKTEKGFFYISYYTPIKRPTTITGYDETFNGTIYSNAESPDQSNAKYVTGDTLYYGDVYTVNDSDAILKEVSFFIQQYDGGTTSLNSTPDVGYGQDYRINAEVYAAVGEKTESNDAIYKRAVTEGKKTSTQAFNYSGFQTLKLDSSISVANKKVAIVVKLTKQTADGRRMYVPTEKTTAVKTGTGVWSTDGKTFTVAATDVYVSAILANTQDTGSQADGVMYPYNWDGAKQVIEQPGTNPGTTTPPVTTTTTAAPPTTVTTTATPTTVTTTAAPTAPTAPTTAPTATTTATTTANPTTVTTTAPPTTVTTTPTPTTVTTTAKPTTTTTTRATTTRVTTVVTTQAPGLLLDISDTSRFSIVLSTDTAGATPLLDGYVYKGTTSANVSLRIYDKVTGTTINCGSTTSATTPVLRTWNTKPDGSGVAPSADGNKSAVPYYWIATADEKYGYTGRIVLQYYFQSAPEGATTATTAAPPTTVTTTAAPTVTTAPPTVITTAVDSIDTSEPVVSSDAPDTGDTSPAPETTTSNDVTYPPTEDTTTEDTTVPTERPFEKINLSKAEIILPQYEYEYMGVAVFPEYVDVVLDGLWLYENEEFTVKIANNSGLGTADVIITGIGNYSGQVIAHFEIFNDIYTDLAEVSPIITFDDDIIYDENNPATPIPTITIGDKVLEYDTDFIVEYMGNDDVGTAAAIIFGVGEYSGKLGAIFVISPTSERLDIARATVIAPAIADIIIEVPITVLYGEDTLELGTDYTTAYFNNGQTGLAGIKITGIGKYKNSIGVAYSATESESEGENNSSKNPCNP